MEKTILLTAGGTGGHLFPAQALAGELAARGFVVELATDERADRYGQSFPARKIHIVSSETVRGKSPVALARTAFALARGFFQSLVILRRLKPRVVVGFGGYPTFPPMMAARVLGIPTILHEQNAVMGRANRMLARFVTGIAQSFAETRLAEPFAAKAGHTGNPVRPAVIEDAKTSYDPPSLDKSFRLLVFGGSQGARFFSEMIPDALAELDPTLRQRLALVQQCRPEDIDRVRARYDELGVDVSLAPFFVDMPARIALSHLVICRSGASSVAELSVIGRPSILVPLPHALDQDQSANAEVLEEAGGAWCIPQADLTARRMAKELAELMDDPDRLIAAANAAHTQGRPDAVKRLADLVEHVAGGGKASVY
ncbi:UDP-N-acetylglucosamine-N-acetylmuramylpentapeptide N-acetylglucosamine transferase [Breoghania corrubedonensis]|uniref:UDP-N-acetylglucosamine--N-acetylmuramyl-(pentapeptide) pyrophosphoryl-undecaprenol N-acetylglucosamine transferase n=1 Tax=Breoghania corrubedonensis TaxID=665038 RepID=A0A2T5V4X7_9HYPH|nr:undecaprenyldiphospho-muramoylpentapeptide beta-N-acetylglucosaminyltransferase [Breoghania corrubedonensis]PTW58808.1 UDP-N-acetylglucosamine-N-acetylmuramylpentapeptide N-acetylglucosamine transferase [Breoghania corrubedonensis]